MATKEVLIQRVMVREIDISGAVMDCFIKGDQQGFIASCGRVCSAAQVYRTHLGAEQFADQTISMDAKLEKLGTRELQNLINDLSELVKT